VGLGKTISAGLVLSELIARGRVSKFLVVCPKLLGPQWKTELAEKFATPSDVAAGRELLRDHRTPGAAGTITTYNSARLYLSPCPRIDSTC
jgi:SNF2 family DNA or RNA helicase